VTPKERTFPDRIDTSIRGVGRLHIAHGAKTRAEYLKRRALVSKLRDTGRLDILHAIRRRDVSFLEVYAADLSGSLGSVLSDLKGNRGLWLAVSEWVPVSAKAEATRVRYKGAWRTLRKVSKLPETATVDDLARVDWRSLYVGWPWSAAHWNNCRRAVSAFLSHVYGKQSPQRYGTLSGYPLAKEAARVVTLTPGDFRAVLNNMPAPYVSSFIALAATGMRIRSEYLRCSEFDVKPQGVMVPGTKTPGSHNMVYVADALMPHIRDAIPCPWTYYQLRRVWQQSCKQAGHMPSGSAAPRLNDLRHCFGQWLSDAGRPLASIQASMRHENVSTTARYTATTMRQEDAVAMGLILNPQQ
jgi:integrase